MSFPGAHETYSVDNPELNDGSIFRIRDIDLQLYWSNKNSAEFYKFLRSVPSGKTLMQPRWEYGETDKTKPFVVVKLDAASGATSIDVFDAYNVVAGDVLHNPRTGEHIRIDAVDDSDTISTAATTGYGRAFAGSTAAAMKVGDYLMKIGRVIAHNGLAPDVNNVMPTKNFNHVEFWVKGTHVNEVQGATRMLDGVGQRTEHYARKIWEQDEEINNALFFGKRSLAYEAEGPLYTMNGLDQQIHTHVRSGLGITHPTFELFNEWFSPSFDATSSSATKALFSGQNLYHVFLEAARAVGINPTSYLTRLGSTVTGIDVDGGSIEIVKDYKTLLGPLAGDGFLVDTRHVEFRPFNKYGRVVQTGVQDNDDLFNEKDVFIQAGSLAVFHEESHMRLRDFSGPFGTAIL